MWSVGRFGSATGTRFQPRQHAGRQELGQANRGRRWARVTQESRGEAHRPECPVLEPNDTAVRRQGLAYIEPECPQEPCRANTPAARRTPICDTFRKALKSDLRMFQLSSSGSGHKVPLRPPPAERSPFLTGRCKARQHVRASFLPAYCRQRLCGSKTKCSSGCSGSAPPTPPGHRAKPEPDDGEHHLAGEDWIPLNGNGQASVPGHSRHDSRTHGSVPARCPQAGYYAAATGRAAAARLKAPAVNTAAARCVP